MRINASITLSVTLVFLLHTSTIAATIVSPEEDEQVVAGSRITVVVKPGPGEHWDGFVMGFTALAYDSSDNIYKAVVRIPNEVVGYWNGLTVSGVTSDEEDIAIRRRVFVKPPPGVVLQSIQAMDSLGYSYIILEKMPPNSRPADIKYYESEQIKVYGMYSDGVKRELTASTNGTTYVSSDESVVKVSPEGKLAAQGIGKAGISVRNGEYISKVTVTVEPHTK